MKRFLTLVISIWILGNPFLVNGDVNKVGMILPLSGALAEFGIAMSNGVSLAQADMPGAQCKFIIEDSAYDPKTAVSVFRKFVDIDNLRLIYAFGGPITAVLAPLAKGREVVLVSSETEPGFSIGHDNVIRFNVTSEALAKVQAAGLVRAGYRKIGMVIVDNEYFNGIDRALRKVLPPEVSIEEVARLQPTTTDLSSVVTRLRVKKFDVVGIALFGDMIPFFYREMQRQSLSFPTFSFLSLENDTILKSSSAKIVGATFASTIADESFQKRYQAAFGNRDQVIWAGLAFDYANLLFRELCPLLGNSASDIVSKLRTIKAKGVSGEYQFVQAASGDKFFSFPIVLRKVQEDRTIVAISDQN
jgi:ABC-type branched-subunit amino acid transport system substrate-binding protein